MAPLPIHVERLQASLDDSDLATEQTIQRMARHIRDCANDPVVIAAAHSALRTFGAQPCRPDSGLARWWALTGAAASPRRNLAWSVWWSVKHLLHFTEDEQLLWGLTPNPPELELLVSPSVMVRWRDPEGDCDDFTMLVCCFLQVLDCPWTIATAAVDPHEPWRWSHVYAVAALEDGSQMALDASHGPGPGWHVPSEHVMRYQAWDRSGRPVARRLAAKGLHGYRPRQDAFARVNAWLLTQRGLRGLGQCPDETGADPCAALLASSPFTSAATQVGPTVTTITTPAPVASGFNWGSTLSNLLNQWTAIGGKVIAPTSTYTVGPGGQVSLSTPGALPSGALLTGSTLGTSTGMILLLVGGVVLVMMLAKK